MAACEKRLLIVLDGAPYRNFRRLFGNLEGWVASGDSNLLLEDALLDQLALALSILARMGVPVSTSMTADLFLER